MNSKKIFQKCKLIKLVVTDVDGVLTDGGMYYSEKGEVLKKFNTKDGMGVELLLKANIKTALITKENSLITKKRALKIKASAVYTGIKNKEEEIQKICKKFLIKPENIAYIGDDINDINIIKLVGFSASPNNAVPQVKQIVDYVCDKEGGDGVFREVADIILKVKNFSSK